MILNWETLKEEAPVAIQVIEKETGYKYDSVYGTLRNNHGHPIRFEDLEDFFDNQGWKMTIIPLNHPFFTGIISDRNGDHIYQNHSDFRDVKSRAHAKALLAGIAIKTFDLFVVDSMIKPEVKTACLIYRPSLQESAVTKPLDQVLFSDLVLDAQGIVETEKFVVLCEDMEHATSKSIGKVIKNTGGFPYVGMIIPM